jgi:hypothetical protein
MEKPNVLFSNKNAGASGSGKGLVDMEKGKI